SRPSRCGRSTGRRTCRCRSWRERAARRWGQTKAGRPRSRSRRYASARCGCAMWRGTRWRWRWWRARCTRWTAAAPTGARRSWTARCGATRSAARCTAFATTCGRARPPGRRAGHRRRRTRRAWTTVSSTSRWAGGRETLPPSVARGLAPARPAPRHVRSGKVQPERGGGSTMRWALLSWLAVVLALGVGCSAPAAPSGIAASPASGAAAPAPAAATPALATPASQTPVVLAASENVTSNVFVWLARDQGLFQQYNVAIDLQTINAINAIKALVAGQLDGVLLGSPEVVAARASGMDLTIVAVFVSLYNQIMVVPPEITSVEQLRG